MRVSTVKRWNVVAMNAAAALVVAFSGPVEDTPAVVPGMTHIHGLGINPSDQRLYVATHYGLFRIAEDDAPQRVGDSMQDFMGFTVTGADEFLASGHPDPGEAAWEQLRFCESGGVYTVDTGNGFYGAYQFDLQTWASMGGSGQPSDAPFWEQDLRAKGLFWARGSQPWPVCGRFLD